MVSVASVLWGYACDWMIPDCFHQNPSAFSANSPRYSRRDICWGDHVEMLEDLMEGVRPCSGRKGSVVMRHAEGVSGTPWDSFLTFLKVSLIRMRQQ